MRSNGTTFSQPSPAIPPSAPRGTRWSKSACGPADSDQRADGLERLRPFAGLRIDRLEVARAIEGDELGFGAGGLDVALAHRVWHVGVLRPVDEDLGDAEREQPEGRRLGVMIGNLA